MTEDKTEHEFERASFVTSSTLPPGSFEQITRLALLCMFGVTLAVFAQGLFGSFVWGDTLLITQNQNLRDGQLSQLLLAPFWNVSQTVLGDFRYYRPLVTLSYALELRAYGERPFGYHITNLLLHAGCVFLVFKWLFSRLLREVDGARAWQALAGALAGALLFSVHPSRVEVVSWISGRTDSMMALFALLGLSWFERSRGPLRGPITGACFVLALLCKESIAAVPLCLLLESFLRGERERRDGAVRHAAIALAITVVAVVVRTLIVTLPARSASELFTQPLERVTSTLGHFVACVLWPVAPSLITAPQVLEPGGRIAYTPESVLIGVITLAAFAALAWAARKHAGLRPWLCDALWFLVPLLPVLNIIPLDLKALVANRFLYLPLLGVAALLARLLPAGFSRRDPLPLLTLLAAVFVVVSCSYLTTRYEPAFASDEASIEYEHRLHPEDTLLLQELAQRQADRGQVGAALRTTLEGYRSAERQREHHARTKFLLLAASYLGNGLHDFQIAELQALAGFYVALEREPVAKLEISPVRIAFTPSPLERERILRSVDEYVVPRALVEARLGDLDGALARLSAVTARDPRATSAFRTLALLRARQEDFSAAFGELARAEAIAPGQGETLALRQRLLDAQELFTRPASSELERALGRAHGFLVLGSPALAARAIDAALEQAPDDPALNATRIRIDAIDTNFSGARKRAQAAITRSPALAEALSGTLRELEAVERAQPPILP